MIIFRTEEFRKAVKNKRYLEDEESIKVSCKKIGIAQSTLSRIERGDIPDMTVFTKILNWLNHEANKYIK